MRLAETEYDVVLGKLSRRHVVWKSRLPKHFPLNFFGDPRHFPAFHFIIQLKVLDP
ncbi:hypothetical protein Lser_V15G06545 [Lactuca serriola]